jgi:Protease inhibitor Inh
LIVMTLAGCAGQQLSFGNASASAPPAPQVDMAGRWRLAVPGSPSCGMHFGGGPGIRAGAVQPEGGCPGQFFTARHWELTPDNQQLVIDDYQMNPLAQLQWADGSFTGKNKAGRPMTLTRFPSPQPG